MINESKVKNGKLKEDPSDFYFLPLTFNFITLIIYAFPTETQKEISNCLDDSLRFYDFEYGAYVPPWFV